jgi:hypothetical protein
MLKLEVCDRSNWFFPSGRTSIESSLGSLLVTGLIWSCRQCLTVEKVEMAPRNHRLVCFLMPDGTNAPFCAILLPNAELKETEVAIREHLISQVPAGWIPSLFVFLTKMTLNISDKIDRQYLLQLYKDSNQSFSPQPQTFPPSHGPSSCVKESDPAASSETEAVIRQAWSQVLGVDASHIRDDSNFVSLGGSSINAIKLVAV